MDVLLVWAQLEELAGMGGTRRGLGVGIGEGEPRSIYCRLIKLPGPWVLKDFYVFQYVLFPVSDLILGGGQVSKLGPSWAKNR